MYSSVLQFCSFNASCNRRLLWNGLLFLLVSLGLVTASPLARAVSPPPDGGYPNENTAEGINALQSLTTGLDNTATGFQALFSNTTGTFNTATGAVALYSNTTGGANTATGLSALESNTKGNNNTGRRLFCAQQRHNRHRQHSDRGRGALT